MAPVMAQISPASQGGEQLLKHPLRRAWLFSLFSDCFRAETLIYSALVCDAVHIEFQLQTENVLSLLRSRLKSQLPCVTDVFTVPVNGHLVPCVIDHIRVPSTTHLERVSVPDIIVYGTHHLSGSAIRVVQPFSFYIAPLSKLEQANNHPLAEYVVIDLEIIFDLKVVIAKEVVQPKTGKTVELEPEIHLDFAELRTVLGQPTPSDLADVFTNTLGSFLKPSPLDLTPLEDFRGPFAIAEAALNAGSDLSFIAIRIEILSLDLEGPTAWGAFYNGHIDNRLHVTWTDPTPVEFNSSGKPIKKDPSDPSQQHPVIHTVDGTWSLFIDPEFLLPKIASMIKDGLAQDSQFDLDEQKGIDAFFDPSGHLARFITMFSGDITEVGLFHQDVHVDVTVSALLALDGPTQIRTATGIEYDVDDFDELKVELLNALPVAHLGAILGGGAGPIGAAIGAMVGYVVGFFGAVAVVSLYSPPIALPDCKKVSDLAFDCAFPLDVPASPLFGKLEFTQIIGLSSGPLFLGNLPQLSESTDLELTRVDLLPSTYGYRDVCGSPWLGVSGGIALYGKGSRSLHLCRKPEPIAGSDPKQQFAGVIHVTEYADGGQESSVSVDISLATTALLPDYLSNPYPLQLLLQTNAGVRQVTLDGINPLTQQQVTDLELRLVAAKANCVKLADAFWGATGRFNPKWSVDPGPEGSQAAKWWNVTVIGLEPNELLGLDVGGQSIFQSAPDTFGIARAEAVILPSELGDLSIKRTKSGNVSAAFHSEGASRRADRMAKRLRINQTLLNLGTEFRFGSRCVAALPGRVAGQTVMFCATEGGRHYLFDISNPKVPALLRRLDRTGVRGALQWKDGFLLWGEVGLIPVTRELRCEPPQSLIEKGLPRWPVSSATVVDGQLHLVNADGQLHVFDSGGHSVEASPIKTVQLRPFSLSPWFADVRRGGRILARTAGDRVELWTMGRSAVLG
jgi:hypothetical protein